MLCGNCGKEIKEGMDYCEECGAPLEEPTVITLTKEAIKTTKKKAEPIAVTGPFFDFSGFLGGLKSSVSIFLAFVGAIFLYLSAFSTWLWQQLFDEKKSANLFDLGAKSNEMYIGKKYFITFGIVILLTGLLMLVMSSDSYLRPLKALGKSNIVKILLKLLPILIGVVVFLLIWKDKLYVQAYNNIKNLINLAQSIGAASNYKGGRGAGPILYIVGMVLYTLSILFEKKED